MATVGATTSTTATQSWAQRKAFYANGRHWVFYSDGIDGVYRTSVDGVSWSNAIAFISGVTVGVWFSIWFDGTYLHYAYADEVAGNPIYYRRGTPNSDGTITWSAEQTAVAGVSGSIYNEPSVCADTSGFVWISYLQSSGTPMVWYPYITKSGNNNGTWGTTPVGFPYQLNATSSTSWRNNTIPLTTGRVLTIYVTNDATLKMRIRRWDGSTWESELTSASRPRSSVASVVADGDDAYITFQEYTNLPILCVKYIYSTNSLGSEVTVQAAIPLGAACSLSKDSDGNLRCFWAGSPTAHHIYYKKYNGASWDTDPTDWIDESTDGIAAYLTLSCFYRQYGDGIGLIYMTKTVSPYNVSYAFLETPIEKSSSDEGTSAEVSCFPKFSQDQGYCGQVLEG